MSEKNQNQEKWRTEILREQRKERLARLKSKDGGKKPIKTTNRVATLITILVLVIVDFGGRHLVGIQPRCAPSLHHRLDRWR
ncbi:MAG: hypothetical protein ACOX1A_08300 [Saccharofermentanales bacterium]